MSRKTINILAAIVLPAFVILAGSLYFSNSKKKVIDSSSSVIPDENNAGSKNLRSFFNNENDYDSAFSHAQNSEKMNVIAGMTSHHFLAKDLIARFYSGIANDSIRNVIIVGPDHRGVFGGSDADAFTTELEWDTPFGEIKSNKELIGEILKEDNVKMNDDVFKTEHSIYTEVPFVKKVFPQAGIIPLVVRNIRDYDRFMKIGQDIKRMSGGNALLVVSSDFSHEASMGEAKMNDDRSIAALKDLQLGNLDRMNCDCRACMAVMRGFLDGENVNFHLVENRNSSDFGSTDEKVTSYVSGYFLAE